MKVKPKLTKPTPHPTGFIYEVSSVSWYVNPITRVEEDHYISRKKYYPKADGSFPSTMNWAIEEALLGKRKAYTHGDGTEAWGETKIYRYDFAADITSKIVSGEIKS